MSDNYNHIRNILARYRYDASYSLDDLTNLLAGAKYDFDRLAAEIMEEQIVDDTDLTYNDGLEAAAAIVRFEQNR